MMTDGKSYQVRLKNTSSKTSFVYKKLLIFRKMPKNKRRNLKTLSKALKKIEAGILCKTNATDQQT